jgi:hypothetical protein
VPLATEHALCLAEKRELLQSLAIVEPLQRLCWVFGDFETLTRIGRAYKNLGDKSWEGLGPPYGPLPKGAASVQLYGKAFNLYEDAFLMSGGDYFPGVNATTLALLTGNKTAARDYASKVLVAGRRAEITARGESLYWTLASEGEASLALSRSEDARDYYRNALNYVLPGQIRMVQSSWDQLCRLWCLLGPAVVGPVVQVFQGRTDLWGLLKRGPLDDCGFNGSRKTAVVKKK